MTGCGFGRNLTAARQCVILGLATACVVLPMEKGVGTTIAVHECGARSADNIRQFQAVLTQLHSPADPADLQRVVVNLCMGGQSERAAFGSVMAILKGDPDNEEIVEQPHAASMEPKHPFVTAQGAILCPNYFAIKDAKAALAAGDKVWLQKTGCIQAQGELRVVLIDTPLSAVSGSPSSDLPWRGRVYPPDNEADGETVYFDPWEISTYAFATVPYKTEDHPMPGFPPLPPTWWSGDKPVAFKNAADGERWYAQNITDRNKPYVPHTVVSDGGGAFRLLLGPTAYGLLHQICANGKPSCHVLGQLPR